MKKGYLVNGKVTIYKEYSILVDEETIDDDDKVLNMFDTFAISEGIKEEDIDTTEMGDFQKVRLSEETFKKYLNKSLEFENCIEIIQENKV